MLKPDLMWTPEINTFIFLIVIFGVGYLFYFLFFDMLYYL